MITQKLFTQTDYPCIKDELFDHETNELTIEVFTSDETELPPGVWMNDLGIYELVIAGNSITQNLLKQSLTELTEVTGITYEVEFGK